MRKVTRTVLLTWFVLSLSGCGDQSEDSAISNAIDTTKEAASEAVNATANAANEAVEDVDLTAQEASDVVMQAANDALQSIDDKLKPVSTEVSQDEAGDATSENGIIAEADVAVEKEPMASADSLELSAANELDANQPDQTTVVETIEEALDDAPENSSSDE